MLYAWLTYRTGGVGALNTRIWKSALFRRKNSSCEGEIDHSICSRSKSALPLHKNRKSSMEREEVQLCSYQVKQHQMI